MKTKEQPLKYLLYFSVFVAFVFLVVKLASIILGIDLPVCH